MAKISELDPVPAPDGSEQVPIVKDGVAKKTTLGSLVAAVAQPFVDLAEEHALDAEEWAAQAEASASRVGLTPIILPGADSYPNLNYAANTLELPADTLIIGNSATYAIAAATSVDLSTLGTTTKKVYYVAGAGTFAVKQWDSILSAAEKLTHHLIAVIRRTSSVSQSHLSMACPCTVDGIVQGKASPHFLSPIIMSNTVAPYFPNLDTAAGTLQIYGSDGVLIDRFGPKTLPAAVINLGVVGSSAKKVFYNSTTTSYVVKNYFDALTSDEAKQLNLIAVIRSSGASASALSMACPCTVNGGVQGLSGSQTTEWAAIHTPYTGGVTPTTNLPNFASATNILTLFKDTILYGRNKTYALPANVEVGYSAGSSAWRVYWNPTTNTFESKTWGTLLTAAEMTNLVLVAAIRDGSPNGLVPTLSMTCPYTVDGKLFGYISNYTTGGSVGDAENRAGDTVEGIMHRGYSAIAPENTLAAHKAAAKANRYIVEGDIQWTSDDVAVLLHDDTIDRTSDGTGAIAGMTLATAKTYDFGSWKGAAFTGEEIPTWDEYLIHAKKLGLYGHFEIKTDATLTQVQGLIASVRKAGMKKRLHFDSFILAALQKVVAEDPAQDVGYLVWTTTDAEWTAAIATAASLKTASNRVAIQPVITNLTKARVEEAHNAGLQVIIHTINSTAEVATVTEMGVDGIMTDTLNIAQTIRDAEL